VRLWDVESSRERVLRGHADGVSKVAFSPDGRSLASVARDGTAKLWNVQSAEVVRTLRHPGNLVDVGFSPDGGRLVTASLSDNSAWVWDLRSGEGRLLPQDGYHGVERAAFLADGGRVLTTTQDGGITVWLDDLPHDAGELRAWLSRATDLVVDGAAGETSLPEAR
jgi:WD40 repeat protein